MLVGEVLDELLADGEVEVELSAGPGGVEGKGLGIVVDDETSEAVDAGIVDANGISGGVRDDVASGESVAVGPSNDVELGLGPCQVGDENLLDLGDGGDGEHHGNAGGVGRRSGNLDFEGREGSGIIFLDADFKSVQKQIILNNSCFESHFPVGQEHLDVFAGVTSA